MTGKSAKELYAECEKLLSEIQRWSGRHFISGNLPPGEPRGIVTLEDHEEVTQLVTQLRRKTKELFEASLKRIRDE